MTTLIWILSLGLNSISNQSSHQLRLLVMPSQKKVDILYGFLEKSFNITTFGMSISSTYVGLENKFLPKENTCIT